MLLCTVFGRFVFTSFRILIDFSAYRSNSRRGRQETQPLWTNPDYDIALGRRRFALKKTFSQSISRGYPRGEGG